MSNDTENASTIHQASETVGDAARAVRHALEEGQVPGLSADTVRDIVREAPLIALTSAFLVGFMFARR
jgi:hypothetical protein